MRKSKLLLYALLFLILVPQVGNVTNQPKVKTFGSQPKFSFPASPRKSFDQGIVHDALSAIDRLFQSAEHYGYWLPSNVPNVWATSNFGIATTGSTSYPTSTQTIGGISGAGYTTGLVEAFPITVTMTGTVTSIGAQYYYGGAAGNIEVAIYSAGSGKPASLLGNSPSVAVTSNTAWNDIALTTPVNVVATTTYWLAFQTSSNTPKFYYQTGSRSYYSKSYGSFDSTWSASSTQDNSQQYNMRITFVQIMGYTEGTQVEYSGPTTTSGASSFSFYISTYNSGDKIVLAFI